MNLDELTPPEDLPDVGLVVPAAIIRIALAVTGIALTLVVFSATGWIGVGILISLIAALAPDYLAAWVLMAFLAVGELSHREALDWRVLVLLAGVHLLHVLGLLALELPWRSWIQPAAFAGPLLRFIAIQVPSQLLAIVALSVLGPNHDGHRPVTVAAVAVIGAVALGGIAALLLREDETPAAR